MRAQPTSLPAIVFCMLTTIVLASLIPAAQLRAQNPNPANPAPPNGTPNSQTTLTLQEDNSTQIPDKVFLRKAGEGGLAEVQMGQLAAQKGNSDEVRKFGQKMVEDHTRLNEQMKPVAESLGVYPPEHLNKADQAEYGKLRGLSGDAFDQEYITDMVKDHRKDLHEFRHEERKTSNTNVQAAVAQAEPVISQHLSMIQGIAQQKGIQVPEGHHGNKDNNQAPAPTQ
jgi:putative membrane protein